MQTRKLIASINHATDCLDLYRAELARILGLMCADVGDSLQLEMIINSDSDIRARAGRFVLFVDQLEILFCYDRCKMVHWFRAHHKVLGTSPFLAMVDENRLEDVISVLGIKN